MPVLQCNSVTQCNSLSLSLSFCKPIYYYSGSGFVLSKYSSSLAPLRNQVMAAVRPEGPCSSSFSLSQDGDKVGRIPRSEQQNSITIISLTVSVALGNPHGLGHVSREWGIEVAENAHHLGRISRMAINCQLLVVSVAETGIRAGVLH